MPRWISGGRQLKLGPAMNMKRYEEDREEGFEESDNGNYISIIRCTRVL